MKIQKLIIIIAIWLIPFKMQAQDDPETEIKTPKKMIIDEDIDKYIGKKPIDPKGNALFFDFAALTRGDIAIGYQRKITDLFFAAASYSYHIFKNPFMTYINDMPSLDTDYDKGFTLAEVYEYKQTSNITVSAHYNTYGKILNNAIGFGLFFRQKKHEIIYNALSLSNSMEIKSNYGISISTQANAGGRHFGFGLEGGFGPSTVQIKDGNYSDWVNNLPVKRDSKVGKGISGYFQYKLIYLF